MAKNKKIALKEKYKMLREAGYTSKEAERLRNHSYDNVSKYIKNKSKETAKARKQSQAKENYRFLKEKGLSTKDAARLRYASPETIKEILKTGKAPAKGARQQRANTTGGKMLVMFWKDKTEFVDDTTIQNVKHAYEQETIGFLIQSINGLRGYKGGEIGDYKVEITSKPEQLIRYYHEDWYSVYAGNGTIYKRLLLAVNAICAGLYQPFEKELFLFEMVTKLHEINPKQATRFVNDFQLY